MTPLPSKGFALWFTGLPCSGKTTLAQTMGKELSRNGARVEYIDGDLIRKNLSKDLGFSKEDRQSNIERAAFVASLLVRNGVIVLVSLVSPYRSMRENAKRQIGNFIEIFVNCPLSVCEKRDVKGMYKLARQGQIKNFTGVSDPFEEPLDPEVVVRTDRDPLVVCTAQIMDFLVKKEIVIPPDPFSGNEYLTRAYAFATRCHQGQTRKGKDLPYIVHPLSVAKKLEGFGYPESVIAAGLLHDVLEDTGCEIEDVEKIAGKKAAKIVSEVTDRDKTASWKKRKSNYLARLGKASKDALAVAAADKIDNIESILENYKASGKDFMKLFSSGLKEKIKNYAQVRRLIEKRDPKNVFLELFKQRLKELESL